MTGLKYFQLTWTIQFEYDSKSRKTIEYLDAKLSTLEKQWVEFHERNESIVQNTEDKSEISYFTDNVYGKTKQLYESTKVNMMDLLIYHRQEEKEKPESSVDFDLSGIWEDEPDDNIKILLNQQKCNFKALERAMTKIKIELISEKWELEDHLSTLKGKWDSIDKLHWKLENAKLDAVTLHEYTRDIRDKRELPNLKEFQSFLESKFMALETIKNRQKDGTNNNSQKPSGNMSYNKAANRFHHTYNNYKTNFTEKQNNAKKSTLYKDNKDHASTFYTAFGKCPLCDGEHVLMQCTKFVDMAIPQRNSTIAKLKVCKNCLYSHGNNNCNSSKTCKECNLKHHTLLHIAKRTYEATTKPEKKTPDSQPSTSTQQGSHHLTTKNMEVLLTTVKIRVKTNDGTFVTLRALLDQGSQVNLITENAAQLLRLPRDKLSATVSGVGSVSGDCKGRVQLTCQSIHNDYTITTKAFILKKLTNNLPNCTFEKANWPHLQNLKLGDPDYNGCSLNTYQKA
ncbi:Uncharacterized protein OBRU01_04722 [Operophtera brumata]|uniref:Uncharacterized protein n=1 Tax=Operophtera brumata TaxID=104452 RepID=A0A0L7LNL3_OPEBR|nr:Uncharacterized protein OBRU01_04722 [Operophtera brumata]